MRVSARADYAIRALLELAADRSCTVLVSSHDVDELERLTDWIGFIRNGRLVVVERIADLLRRFRVVDVIASGERALTPIDSAGWIAQESSGRTIRFVDTAHDTPDAAARIAAAYPDTEIRTSGLSLREIFVLLARTHAATPSVEPR